MHDEMCSGELAQTAAVVHASLAPARGRLQPDPAGQPAQAGNGGAGWPGFSANS